MTVNLKKIDLELDQVTFSKQIFRRSRGIVGRVLEQTAKRRTRNIVRKHYQNAVLQVQRQLTVGIPGIASSGSRTIAFNYPDATAGTYVTRHWAALTERYAARAPRSTVFWRKQFGPRGAAGRTLLGDFKSEISRTVSVSSGPVRMEGAQDKSYTVNWDLTVSRLKPPLNAYITESLLAGRAVSRPLGTVNKHSIERIVYVEGRRPFIAGMSASLGRRMRIEIQRSIV